MLREEERVRVCGMAKRRKKNKGKGMTEGRSGLEKVKKKAKEASKRIRVSDEWDGGEGWRERMNRGGCVGRRTKSARWMGEREEGRR